MRTPILFVILIAGMALAQAMTFRPAFANWPPGGRAVCTDPLGQTHSASASDGLGGAFLAWQDHRGPKINVFAQHVLASGEIDPAWPVNGLAMIVDTSLAGAAGGPFAPQVVPDGGNGAYVAWIDLRDADSERLDIVVHHVLVTGETDPEWKPNGLVVVSARGLENSMAVIADGLGEAIVTWVDGRAGGFERDVFAQRVRSTGIADPLWPDQGLAVCAAPGLQAFPAITADGAGGAIVAWEDSRDTSATGVDIFAQHVVVTGSIDRGWPVDGIPVCRAPHDQGRVSIVTDDAGGAIVAWGDSRVIGTGHIFAQRVRAAGFVDPDWPTNGLAVSNAATVESRALAVPDGIGGAVVMWQASLARVQLFAQHVKSSGAVDPTWPAGGRAIGPSNRNHVHSRIVPDDLGGAVIAWEDSLGVFAQHVFGTGERDPSYPDSGRAVSPLSTGEGDPSLVSTGAGGAIVTWTDGRNGNSDVFAMQIIEVGVTGVEDSPPLVASVAVRANPNPARGALTLRFALPRSSTIRLSIVDAAGRRVRGLADGESPAGDQSVRWDLRDDSGRSVEAGLYFARLESEGRVSTAKLVAIR